MDLRSIPMNRPWASALVMPALVLTVAPSLGAQSEDWDAYMGENPDQYASVRVLNGNVTIRKGDMEEALGRGVPVAEGDVLESHGRGILQLADGTQVAFGQDTRFQVAGLFKERSGYRQVFLRLDRGRLRVLVGRDEDARVRIDTPGGTASLSRGDNASLLVAHETRVEVRAGRIEFSNERDRATLSAGERLLAGDTQDRLDRIQAFNTYGGDSFDAWCDDNMGIRRGASWDRVPEELRYYSSDLDANGEWVYVDAYRSWCWRPIRVAPEWRPYWQGRWAPYPGGMTWVSPEPWSYVTYHHGRWGWAASLGWFWIPGVYYAPAWVAWQSDDAYFGWAPLGYDNAPVPWGYGAWRGGICWNVVDIHIVFSDHAHEHIHREPGPIHHFDPGHGWNGHGGPQRPPWHRGPLPVSPDEARHPDQLQKILKAPNVFSERLQRYAQQNDRIIYQRPSSPGKPGGQPMGFEDRSHLARPQGQKEGTPKPQDQPGSGIIVPPFTKNPKQPGTEPAGPKPGVPDSQGTKPQGQPGGGIIVPPFVKNPKQPGAEPSGPKPGVPDSQGTKPQGQPGGTVIVPPPGKKPTPPPSDSRQNGSGRTDAQAGPSGSSHTGKDQPHAAGGTVVPPAKQEPSSQKPGATQAPPPVWLKKKQPATDQP